MSAHGAEPVKHISYKAAPYLTLILTRIPRQIMNFKSSFEAKVVQQHTVTKPGIKIPHDHVIFCQYMHVIPIIEVFDSQSYTSIHMMSLKDHDHVNIQSLGIIRILHLEFHPFLNFITHVSLAFNTTSPGIT